MRIDSGLSNLLYQSRFQRDAELDEAKVDNGATSRPRTASNPSVSSTLLSSSLASALWAVDGDKRPTSPVEDGAVASSAEKVEAFYLEYALGADEMH